MILVLALSLGVGGSLTPAHAVTECTISGEDASYQIRKITIDSYARGSNLLLDMDPHPAGLVGEEDWHFFAGAWLLRGGTGDAYAYRFFAVGAQFGPPGLQLRFEDQDVVDQMVPTADTIVRGPQGKWAISHEVTPGVYYLVGFGVGDGSWSATARIGGEDVPCEPINVEGRILDFDASDFSGGTHVMAPGVGHGKDLSLSYENPYPFSLGGLFAHEPPPLPAARLTLTTEFGTGTYTQEIAEIRGVARDWDWTAEYTGYPSDAPLIRVLQFDLPFGS